MNYLTLVSTATDDPANLRRQLLREIPDLEISEDRKTYLLHQLAYARTETELRELLLLEPEGRPV